LLKGKKAWNYRIDKHAFAKVKKLQDQEWKTIENTLRWSGCQSLFPCSIKVKSCRKIPLSERNSERGGSPSSPHQDKECKGFLCIVLLFHETLNNYFQSMRSQEFYGILWYIVSLLRTPKNNEERFKKGTGHTKSQVLRRRETADELIPAQHANKPLKLLICLSS
jgi:hypothetical protein